MHTFFVCLPCVCVLVCVLTACSDCAPSLWRRRAWETSPWSKPSSVPTPGYFSFHSRSNMRAPTQQRELSTHACALFFVAAVPGSHTLDAHCTMSCPAEQNSGKITSYVNYVLANARGVLILPCCFQCLDVQEGEGSGECPLFLCQLHRCLALNCGWECMSCESSSFVVLGSA